MIRKSKKFSWPRKLYDKPRILEENELVKKYGLKNKREIWKTEAKVKYFRTRAKALITADQEQQQKFFSKLNEIDLKVGSIADVLALNKEDLLRRRLSTIVASKKIANTPKQARQMIVHKKITINGKVVDVPSYLVKSEEEGTISIRKKVRAAPQQAVAAAEPEGEQNE
jgi:small subunit ribosomal protein S4